MAGNMVSTPVILAVVMATLASLSWHEDRALEQADEEFVVCPLIKEGELRPRAMEALRPTAMETQAQAIRPA